MMNINNILIYTIIVMGIILLLGYNYESFANIQSNKNVYFQDNDNQKYILVPYDNLKPEYKQIIKDNLINNLEFMKKENKNSIINNDKFIKKPLALIKESDKSKITDNLNLTFDIIPNGSNSILTPIINNNKVIDNYIFNDYNTLFYDYDGTNTIETNKNIYLNNITNDLYNISNINNNKPLKIIIS